MITYPVAVKDIVTRVFDAGEPHHPTLILVHGLSSRADRWVRNIDALAAAGYRVLALDLPGHGFATKRGDWPHSIGGYAQFIIDFLDQMGIERATLVGTSLGGQIVSSAACAHPHRIDSLVVIGSTGMKVFPPERVPATRDWLLNNLTPESHRPRLESVFADATLATEDMVIEDVKINTSAGAAESFTRLLDHMEAHGHDDLVLAPLAALSERLPLLLIWGDQDRSVPIEIGRAAREALPNAVALVTLHDISHTPYYETPEVFNGLLLAFLAGKLGEFSAPGMTVS